MSAEERKRLAIRQTIARAVAELDELGGPQRVNGPKQDGYSLLTAEARIERAMGIVAAGQHDDNGFDSGELEKVIDELATARREMQCVRGALERAGVLTAWRVFEDFEHLGPSKASEDDGDDGDDGDPAEVSDDAPIESEDQADATEAH